MKSYKKYWSIFQITLINSLAYPGELIGRSLMIVPFMWIFYQLWNVTFHASGTDTINGMTLYSTMWYLMMAETIELSRPALARTISDNVKDGSIAYLLSKPYSFLLYQFSNSMGETLFRAAGKCALWQCHGLVAGRSTACTAGMGIRHPCLVRYMDTQLLYHLSDRVICFFGRGSFSVFVDLPKVHFHSWRFFNPARFLSQLASSHRQIPAFCCHDLRSIQIVRITINGIIYERPALANSMDHCSWHELLSLPIGAA